MCPLRAAEQEPPGNNNYTKLLNCFWQGGLSQGHHLLPIHPSATLVLAPAGPSPGHCLAAVSEILTWCDTGPKTAIPDSKGGSGLILPHVSPRC